MQLRAVLIQVLRVLRKVAHAARIVLRAASTESSCGLNGASERASTSPTCGYCTSLLKFS